MFLFCLLFVVVVVFVLFCFCFCLFCLFVCCFCFVLFCFCLFVCCFVIVVVLGGRCLFLGFSLGFDFGYCIILEILEIRVLDGNV